MKCVCVLSSKQSYAHVLVMFIYYCTFLTAPSSYPGTVAFARWIRWSYEDELECACFLAANQSPLPFHQFPRVLLFHYWLIFSAGRNLSADIDGHHFSSFCWHPNELMQEGRGGEDVGKCAFTHLHTWRDQIAQLIHHLLWTDMSQMCLCWQTLMQSVGD